MLTALLITTAMSFPIRECSTDGDCEAALEELGCVEYYNARRPNVVAKCDRVVYHAAVMDRALFGVLPYQD